MLSGTDSGTKEPSIGVTWRTRPALCKGVTVVLAWYRLSNGSHMRHYKTKFTNKTLALVTRMPNVTTVIYHYWRFSHVPPTASALCCSPVSYQVFEHSSLALSNLMHLFVIIFSASSDWWLLIPFHPLTISTALRYIFFLTFWVSKCILSDPFLYCFWNRIVIMF